MEAIEPREAIEAMEAALAIEELLTADPIEPALAAEAMESTDHAEAIEPALDRDAMLGDRQLGWSSVRTRRRNGEATGPYPGRVICVFDMTSSKW